MDEIERLDFVLQQSKKVAYRTIKKLPQEALGIHRPDDIAQELNIHYLYKMDKYNPEKPFKPWARTVLNNRSITLLTKIWDEYNSGYHSIDPTRTLYSKSIDDNGKVILEVVTGITPEFNLLTEEARRLLMAKEANKVVITKEEIIQLQGRFETKDGKDDLDTLATILETVGALSDDDYNALEKTLVIRVEQLMEAYQDKNLEVVASETKKREPAKAVAGTGRVRTGVIAFVRATFNTGEPPIVTVEAMCAALDALEGGSKIEYSPNSVKTEVGKLRKAAGLSSGRGGKGFAGRGVIKTINEYFNEGKGMLTVKEIRVALDGKNIEYAPATVRTQVTKLRKQYDISKPQQEIDDEAAEKAAAKAAAEKVTTEATEKAAA